MDANGGAVNGRRNPYPELANGLAQLIRATTSLRRDYTDYFGLREQLLVELGNLTLDLAECDADLDFFRLNLRQRIAEIAALADQQPEFGGPMRVQPPEQIPLDTPYPGAYPGAPERQVPGGPPHRGVIAEYDIRDVLTSADRHEQAHAYAPPDHPPADYRTQYVGPAGYPRTNGAR